MSLCKGEGPSYPILKTFCDFLVKKLDFSLIVFSFPTPQVPSPPTKVSQNLIYFSGDPTRSNRLCGILYYYARWTIVLLGQICFVKYKATY